MPTFMLVWFGQVVSLIGSGLTGFTLGIWVYQTTGSTTQFSLIYLCTELPAILIAPVGGAIADRWDRRWLMILSDTGSGLSTLAIAILLWLGNLEVWHIYLAMTVSSTCQGFQWPAYYSTSTLLVAKKHFGRANGMIQLGKAAGQLFSPILAGILVAKIQVHGVILIDFATFALALLTLLLVRFPQHQKHNQNQKTKTPLWQEINSACNYLLERPGLMMLLLFFVVTNFTIGLVQVLITPMVLSFTNAEILGRILSLGCANTIRQVKVAPELQGRVFAMWGAIAWSSFPLAYLVAGALADRIFQPLLLEGGLLADSIGKIVGVGAGRGIGFLFILIGIFIILATITAYQYLPLRLVEDELPDAVIDSFSNS